MDLQIQSNKVTGPGVPRIKYFSTEERFRYLWLKYVTGFDLSVHCARCLLGEYSKHFGAGVTMLADITLDEAPANYYYLCGVTEPFRWADNLHLVFKYKPGSRVLFDWNGTRAEIEDAERIPIKRLKNYGLEPHGEDSEFCTCRNWRFAYQIVHKFD